MPGDFAHEDESAGIQWVNPLSGSLLHLMSKIVWQWTEEILK
jgi:hypothetical protein